MKKTTLTILGVALAGATLVLAQPAEVVHERIPVPPPAPTPPDVDGLLEREHATVNRIAAVAKTQADTQRKLMLAQAGGGGMGGGFSSDLSSASLPRSPRALVIPKSASDARSLGEVEEDLGVMAHILDKAVSSGDKTARAMGIAVFGRIPGMATGPQNLYIEGHGAIFLLNVNLPLQPPPNKSDEPEAKEPVNNEWEEARREMTRPAKGRGGADPFVMFEERFSGEPAWNVKVPAPEYDADKVEDLKKDLINALKNAANIRQLKADELVTVVVTGAEPSVMTKSFKSTSTKPGDSKSERVVMATAAAGERSRGSNSAKLIIRARKADAEAFQNGKLNFEEFRKKVTLLTL